MTSANDVLGFWLDEIEPKSWYVGGDDLDAEIRNRFGDACQEARDGGFGLWLTYPSGTLAYILLTDQFSRNAFRGTAQAFGTDRQARAAAKIAIERKWDMKIDEPARQFFYLPLMHSENLADQDRAVRLIHTRMPKDSGSNMLHARAHRDVIRQFGRFPFRNEALSRCSSAREAEYVAGGGYGSTVRSLSEPA
jgi:uncharacterized protein (DUF924 family)